MKKILALAWKDLTLTFRDPAAVIMMLATPFALTLVMAFAFGGLGGGSSSGSGLRDIPVVLVDRDGGRFGALLVQVFQSPELADLLAPTLADDEAAARAAVDADKAAAAVIIPAGFTAAVMPAGVTAKQAVIEVYRNPARPVGSGVALSIAQQALNSILSGTAGGEVTINQLMRSGLLTPQQAMTSAAAIAERAALSASTQPVLAIRSETAGVPSGEGFDWLSYMMPSMAVMFLMFTVGNGGRSLLLEREGGTLPRLLVTATSPAQIIAGKTAGIYLTGLAQMAILIGAGGILFGIKWGSAEAVIALTLALVAAATGWGLLLAAYTRSSAQVGQLGSMLALVFAIMAGNLVPRQILPAWLRTASYVSPNAWALEGYTSLTAGGGLSDVLLPIAALLTMAGILFAATLVAFRRQYA